MRSWSVSGCRGRNGWQDFCGLQLDPLSVVQGQEGLFGGLGTYFNLCYFAFNLCIIIINQQNKLQTCMVSYASCCPLMGFSVQHNKVSMVKSCDKLHSIYTQPWGARANQPSLPGNMKIGYPVTS